MDENNQAGEESGEDDDVENGESAVINEEEESEEKFIPSIENTSDLSEIKERINDYVRILDDFSKRRDGNKSREDYLIDFPHLFLDFEYFHQYFRFHFSCPQP